MTLTSTGGDKVDLVADFTCGSPRSSEAEVLTIDQATYDAIVAHAKRDHPDEACGVVAGPEGSDRPERFVEMVNAAGSPTFYEFDSTDLLALYREMDDRDEEPVVIYHSHTATEAYPPRPTSAWRASRAPTTCWSAPVSTGITTARWSSGRTGSWTAW